MYQFLRQYDWNKHHLDDDDDGDDDDDDDLFCEIGDKKNIISHFQAITGGYSDRN